jgi:N-acetylglucosamine-6-sulfatase
MERASVSPLVWRGQLLLTALVSVAVCSLVAGCGQTTVAVRPPQRPNVILILADDLDARLLREHPAHYPNLRGLAAEGTTFDNAFVTDSLCCPSRATILRGQYAHNHHIVGNWRPQGGSNKFRELGHEDTTVATWLQDEGYRTVLVGKYMNGYQGGHVPIGWDDWYAIAGNYLSDELDENGRIHRYDPARYHLDDVLAEKATAYVRRSSEDGPPFFLWLGTKAPHAPATPAPRHEHAFPDARMPRPPSFDEGDVSDKPDWVRNNPPLDQVQIDPMDDLYRDRLRSMLAMDEMVGKLRSALRESGELENTYIFFTSDNGWHAGEHRLETGKWTAYEEDIRVPLIVRGPGVPAGRTLHQMVLNNDLAPTFADLAGTKAPTFADGRSLVSLLDESPTPTEDWRSAFLVEAAADSGSAEDPPLSGDPPPRVGLRAPHQVWGRPGLEAVRTEDRLYGEYANGDRELYDLRDDPYQLNNRYAQAQPGLLGPLRERLGALRECSGAECRTVEDGP